MSKLVFKEFNGCGLCDLRKEDCDCKKTDVEVEITFKKAQRADNWGTLVTVFSKGEKVKGRAVIKDNIIYCVSAKANTYEDYEDFVNTGNIDIKIL